MSKIIFYFALAAWHWVKIKRHSQAHFLLRGILQIPRYSYFTYSYDIIKHSLIIRNNPKHITYVEIELYDQKKSSARWKSLGINHVWFKAYLNFFASWWYLDAQSNLGQLTCPFGMHKSKIVMITFEYFFWEGSRL